VIARVADRGHTLGGCRFVRWRERILVLRELARTAEPVRLTPGASVAWDGRFRVELPLTASEPVSVGYLGRAGVIEINDRAPQLQRAGLPRLIFPILPAVWDENGIVAVPHLGYRRERIAALPQFIFRPVNPLTRAGFAVV
jgi:tRNA(Ile)-lysidine synthase